MQQETTWARKRYTNTHYISIEWQPVLFFLLNSKCQASNSLSQNWLLAFYPWVRQYKSSKQGEVIFPLYTILPRDPLCKQKGHTSTYRQKAHPQRREICFSGLSGAHWFIYYQFTQVSPASITAKNQAQSQCELCLQCQTAAPFK